MPIKNLRLPVKVIDGDEWVELSVLASTHYFCAEKFRIELNSFPAAGGHRVRLFSIKNNAHWKIPTSVTQVDIKDVVPIEQAPRRTQRR
jgi:hypothetical protein